MNKLDNFPEQNRNCKSADHQILLNGSGNFPEQIRKISGTSGTLPEHSTVTIWPELFQVEHLKFQAFYLNFLMLTNQSINQPASQPNNQPVSQSVSQSVNQLVSQSINQSVRQPVSQPVSHLVG